MKENKWKKEQDNSNYQNCFELLQDKSFLANESLNPPRSIRSDFHRRRNRFIVSLIRLMEKMPASLVILFFLKCIVIENMRTIATKSFLKFDKGVAISKTSKVLCITHFVGPQKDGFKELYFGKLFSNFSPDELSFFFINHTGINGSKVKRYLETHFNFDFAVSRKTCSNSELLKIILGQLNATGKLLRSSFFQSRDLSAENIAPNKIIRDQFSRATIHNLILTSSILHYIEDNRIEKIVITFEGNPYESCLHYEISRRFPEIEFIFFQHAPLTKTHIGIKRQLSRNLANVTIGASGVITAKVLQDLLSDVNSQKVLVLGSPKFRFSPKESQASFKKVCLIAPEGLMPAVTEMLDLGLNLAREMKDFHFVFRVHPIFDFHLEKLTKSHCLQNSNFEFSKQTIEKDFERSGVCIYRGSSVGIESAAFGIVPIFYSKNGETALDPISFENRGKMQTSDPEQVVESIRLLEKLSIPKLREMIDELKSYNRDYFSPLSPL
jgi:hypothetical protein